MDHTPDFMDDGDAAAVARSIKRVASSNGHESAVGRSPQHFLHPGVP